ncbi:hypothetical protein ABIF07_000258 [Bradyrhizobium elkanii]|nr:hypothetical protein [Bradyrhizobium elkanii]
MGKRLCAPSPRLGLTRRGLSLRVRSNGALAAASSPYQAPGRGLAPPRDRACGDCAPPGHAPAAGSDREVVLPSTPLCRLTGTRGDGCGASRNVKPTLRTISLPAECKAWAARWPRPTKTVSEQSPRSIEDTEDRRSGRDRTKLPGWDWSSFAGAGKQDGRRRRTRRRDGPTGSGSWSALQVVSLGQVE